MKDINTLEKFLNEDLDEYLVITNTSGDQFIIELKSYNIKAMRLDITYQMDKQIKHIIVPLKKIELFHFFNSITLLWGKEILILERF